MSATRAVSSDFQTAAIQRKRAGNSRASLRRGRQNLSWTLRSGGRVTPRGRMPIRSRCRSRAYLDTREMKTRLSLQCASLNAWLSVTSFANQPWNFCACTTPLRSGNRMNMESRTSILMVSVGTERKHSFHIQKCENLFPRVLVEYKRTTRISVRFYWFRRLNYRKVGTTLNYLFITAIPSIIYNIWFVLN